MKKPSLKVWSDANKFLRQTPQLIWISLGVAGIFIGLWWFQQFNVNAFGQKINKLEQKITRVTAVDEKLKLEKDILVIEKDKTTIQNGVYTTLVQAAGGFILSRLMLGIVILELLRISKLRKDLVRRSNTWAARKLGVAELKLDRLLPKITLAIERRATI